VDGEAQSEEQCDEEKSKQDHHCRSFRLCRLLPKR
jgi:hypothetical protein